jgi:phage shock protein C
MTRLYRSESDKILGGVCGGIAEVYDLDPSLVRLVTILLAFTGSAELVYLIAWLIVPKESEIKQDKEEDSEEE